MTVRSEAAEQRATVQSDDSAGLLAGAIDDIELGLLQDDPDFVRRMHRLQRAEVRNGVAVVVLLVASAALLTVGLATQSAVAWLAGGLAFLSAFGVDGRYRRKLVAATTAGLATDTTGD